jgi:prepilin-type N-terminal cleavage/methylation domain-containing protein
MRRKHQHGFTLLEVLIAMVLVGMSLSTLVMAFLASGQFGLLARRQATAITIARSLATSLSHAPYGDARLANNNPNNDATFADPAGLFAHSSLPTGNDAPDYSVPGTTTVGNETYEVYVNVAPQTDPSNAASEIGRLLAVVVRYHVNSKYMRAIAIGFRYNPAVVGVVGQLPL